MWKTLRAVMVAVLLLCVSEPTKADLTPRFDLGESFSYGEPGQRNSSTDASALLFRAIWDGDAEKVDSLIDDIGDVNVRDEAGNTPLHVAAISKSTSPEVITLLFEHGADPDIKNGKGLTPADLAMQYLRHEVTALLVKKGAAVSSLQMAAYLGQEDRVEAFVERGMAVDDRDDVGRTALFYAACAGYDALAERLIARGADVHAAQGNSHQTALHGAAICGHASTTQLLLDRGARVNAVDGLGQTPLQYACVSGSIDTAALLIANEADVSIPDASGRSVLHWAAAIGSPRLAALTLSKGADINAPDQEGQTPLDVAVYGGSKEMVKLLVSGGAQVSSLFTGALLGDVNRLKALIAEGADVNAKADNGATVLHNAALAGDLKVIEYLLDQEAEIDAANERGLTPLHNATLAGHCVAAECLCNRGASVGAQTIDGYTALHLAVMRGDARLVELLTALGADRKVEDNSGMTPLMLAEQTGNKDILQLLR